MAKKPTEARQVIQPTLKQHFSASESLAVAEWILSDHILEAASQQLYLKYLIPKVKPYTALHALESVKKQL